MFSVSAPNLKDFHTVKGDVKKGNSKMPPDTHLMREEGGEESKQFAPPGGDKPERSRGQTLFSKNGD